MRDNGYTRVVPTVEAEQAWTERVHEMAARMLFTKVDSWFMGINTNVPGKQKRTFLLYSGGPPSTERNATRRPQKAMQGSCSNKHGQVAKEGLLPPRNRYRGLMG